MTSNRPLEDGGKLLADVPTATAVLDRFLHRAEIISITGKSYRLKDKAACKAEPKSQERVLLGWWFWSDQTRPVLNRPMTISMKLGGLCLEKGCYLINPARHCNVKKCVRRSSHLIDSRGSSKYVHYVSRSAWVVKRAISLLLLVAFCVQSVEPAPCFDAGHPQLICDVDSDNDTAKYSHKYDAGVAIVAVPPADEPVFTCVDTVISIQVLEPYTSFLPRGPPQVWIFPRSRWIHSVIRSRVRAKFDCHCSLMLQKELLCSGCVAS
jgi:hypothetical protein